MCPPPPAIEPLRGTLIGPYRVCGELGRGGMATVLEVEDTRDGRVLALKLVHNEHTDPEVLARFDVEFRTMSSLDHPNILKVHEAGTLEGRPWFTMDKLLGSDLRATVESWKELAPTERFTRAESILADVAAALAYVHEQGLVHRDVTPGNIMVGPDGTARLTDFGVVHAPGVELTTVGEMVGTVSYIAPEQISTDVSGGRVDGRADLYALGGVLYLMLTGRRPFSATTIPSLLEKHLHAAPRPPREVVPTVPGHLDDICLRLLEKKPERRYGSAQHLLSVLDRRASLLKKVDLKSWPPRLVGRTPELAQLRDAVTALAHGRGGALVVEGPSGFGKTRLLEALEAQAKALELPLSRGRCTSSDAPFAGLAGVVPDIVQGTMPPSLEIAFGGGDGPVEQYRVLKDVADALRNSLPRVVIVDSFHHADRGTVALVDFLLRNLRELADEPVLFVIGRRPPGGEDPLLDHLLDGLADCIELRPITVTAVEELLLQLVAPDDRTRVLAQRLHREGEGNPHFIGEMIRGLVEQGVITEESPGRYALGLDITHVSRARLPIPTSIREALEERLAALSPAALQLAEALATCRHEVPIEVLEEALGQHEERVLHLLEELLDQHVASARVVGLDELYDVAQPRLRTVLTRKVLPQAARVLHRRLGSALERLYRHRLSSVLESIAWHFEQGEVPAKAYPYLVQAGRRLQERSFVAEAMEFYERAMSIEPEAREFMTLDAADHQLAELYLHRSQAFFHLGNWADAERQAEAADVLAREIDDARTRSRSLTELGGLARRQVRIDAAEAYFTEARALATELGEPSLRVEPLLGLAAVRWGRGDLDGARQIWLESMVAANAARSEVSRGRSLNGLGLVAFCRGQAADARRHLEEAAEIFGRLGKLTPLVVTRVNLVELYHCTGNLRKGLKLADRTIAQAREIQYRYGLALGLQYRSMLLVDLGRYPEAEENAREAMHIVSDFEQSEDTLAIQASLVRVALGRKDLDTARELVAEGLGQLRDQDVEGYAPLFHAWQARLHAEDGDVGELHASLARADEAQGRTWPHQECRLDIIAARALAAAGDRDGAVAKAMQALKRADGCGYRFYSLKAHSLIARYATDDTTLALHRRVAAALSKSLAANLSRDDSAAFLSRNALK
ncbi:MAG: protein kinase [Proteobacteria bacterium]|nr:protein kinase [Pseudomonadota bacterium]MCP4920553.1 protein kinase [Pseudomonadota bacterium]